MKNRKEGFGELFKFTAQDLLAGLSWAHTDSFGFQKAV